MRLNSICAALSGRSTSRPPTPPASRAATADTDESNVPASGYCAFDGHILTADPVEPGDVARCVLREQVQLADEWRHHDPDERDHDHRCGQLDERDRAAARHTTAFQCGGRPGDRRRNENGQEHEDKDVLELSEDAQTRHGEHRQHQSQCDRLRAIERGLARSASAGGLGPRGICGVAILHRGPPCAGGCGPPHALGRIYAVAPVGVVDVRFMMRPPPIATMSSVTPLTSENAAIRASRTSAPSPGFTNITRPNRMETSPLRDSSKASPPSTGSQKAPAMAITPTAIA